MKDSIMLWGALTLAVLGPGLADLLMDYIL